MQLTTFAYLDCSIFLICWSGLVWESFPTNKVYVAILSRLGDVRLRLTRLLRRERFEPMDASVLTNTFQLVQITHGQPEEHSTGCGHRLAGQE